LARNKEAALNSLLKQVLIIVFSGLITIVGWLAKNQITIATKTISENKTRIDANNRDMLLKRQNTDFKILMLQRDIADLRRRLEEKIQEE
jgi:hypothetical protein